MNLDSNPTQLERNNLTRFSPIFAALGDVTRLQLVHRLGEGGPRSIAQLASGLNISHQGVTKHLRVLENSGLIQAQRVGRERQYSCAPNVLKEARNYLDNIGDQWEGALLRLQAFVEDEK